MKIISFIIALITLSPLCAELPESPFAIYLTWHADPTTSMNINLIEEGEFRPVSIEYRSDKDKKWKKSTSTSHFFEAPYSVYSFELSHLRSDTSYRFRINGYAVEHLFSTMPKTLKKPLSFVVGGDINLSSTSAPLFEETNQQIAIRRPSFAALGGDLASSGSSSKLDEEDDKRWFAWFSIWYKTMITPEGRVIPLITSIGNHDVDGGHEQPPEKARLFYKFFRKDGERGYLSYHFGSYLSLYLLDSNHTTPAKGLQSLWMASHLYLDRKFPHKIAVYHISAYPPVRSNGYEYGEYIRRDWVPIFDMFRLHLAFEHHDHAYKRTFPITGGSFDPYGVVYVGNGPWGKNPREPKNVQKGSPLFEKTAQARQFCEVTLHAKRRDVQAIAFDGTVIDSFSQVTDDQLAKRLAEHQRRIRKSRPKH